MPYVLQPGKAGDKVPDDYVIYTSRNCLDVLRQPTRDDNRPDGAVTITGAALQFEVPKIIKKLEQDKTKLDDLNRRLANISFPTTSVVSLKDWFDKMDEYVDSLPDMSEEVTNVYEVSLTNNEWRYTGTVEPMDSEWNEKINEAKRHICEELNAKLQKVTDTMTDLLQSLADRMGVCGPFIKIIMSIKQVPSIETIISWAKSVISFLFYTYELIYDVYSMAMQILELVVLRFPQLVSKFMSKMANFKCSINVKVTSITVNRN